MLSANILDEAFLRRAQRSSAYLEYARQTGILSCSAKPSSGPDAWSVQRLPVEVSLLENLISVEIGVGAMYQLFERLRHFVDGPGSDAPSCLIVEKKRVLDVHGCQCGVRDAHNTIRPDLQWRDAGVRVADKICREGALTSNRLG